MAVPVARSGTVTHAPWRKGQPQTPYQANLSVRIAQRNPKGTATSAISSGFLCSNSSSEPGRDSHKHHIKWISLFERAKATISMARQAELASTTETVSCIWFPDLRSQACATSGAGIIYSEIVRTGTQTRYAPYAVLGSDVRAFRLCANASEP